VVTMTFAGLSYSNGSVPSALLAPLEGQSGAYLRRDAAAAWNRARDEVREKTGIVLTVRGWNRSLSEQIRFFTERYEPRDWPYTGPFNDVRHWNGRRYVRMRGGSVAIPGTSNHGWGLAVDVVDFGGIGEWNYPRRRAAWPILAKHGWTDTEGRQSWVDEPWHIVYSPGADLVARQVSSGGTVTTPNLPDAPAPITPEEGFLMALSDEKQQELYELLTTKVVDPAYPDTPIPLPTAIGRMFTLIREERGETVKDVAYPDKPIPKKEALGRVLTIARRLDERTEQEG
jgi:hypothetical protein